MSSRACTTARRGRRTTDTCSTHVPTTRGARIRSGATRWARPADTDVLVYQEDDTHFDVGVDNTRSGRFVIISSDSRTTSEVRLLDATDPACSRAIVEPREQGHEYTVDHQGDRLLIVTNLDALDFRLVETPDRRTRAVVVEGGAAASSGRAPLRGRRVRRSCRRVRVGRRPPDPARDPLRRVAVRHRPARDGLRPVGGHEPRVRDHDVSLQLPVADHAALGVRGGPRDQRPHLAQAAAGPRGLRRVRLRDSAHRGRLHPTTRWFRSLSWPARACLAMARTPRCCTATAPTR